MIPIPDGKEKQAQEIINRISEELDKTEGYSGYDASIEGNKVWIRHEESINQEHVNALVNALVEELEIDDPVTVSWAYTCSKPRVGEFGGGAFVVVRGKGSAWVDAADEAEQIASNPFHPKNRLKAIVARIDGVFDCPELEAFGPLSIDTMADVKRIAEQEEQL